MQVRISIGLTAFSAEKKQRLLQAMQQKLPDPAVYNGHEYTECFRLDDEPIVMNKRPDGSVELSLTTDSTRVMYPLVA